MRRTLAGAAQESKPAPWIVMSDAAEVEIAHLADIPIGAAFVDAAGNPGCPGNNPVLTIRHPRIRGCLPRVDGLEPEIPRGRRPGDENG
jgi:hypothetical protein